MYYPLNFVNSHFLSYNLTPLHSNSKPVTNLPLMLDGSIFFIIIHKLTSKMSEARKPFLDQLIV